MKRKTLLAALIAVGILVASMRVWSGKNGSEPGPETAPRPGAEDTMAFPSSAPRSAAAPKQLQGKLRTSTPAMLRAPAAPTSAEAEALRRPVIEAIRASGVSLDEKREAMVRAVTNSGDTREAWTAQASGTFDAWRRGMPEATQRGVQLGTVSCFKAGCLSEVSFRDEATYRAAAGAFRALSSDTGSHGGRVQTPPDLRNGKAVGYWIMLRPEGQASEADEDDV